MDNISAKMNESAAKYRRIVRINSDSRLEGRIKYSILSAIYYSLLGNLYNKPWDNIFDEINNKIKLNLK